MRAPGLLLAVAILLAAGCAGGPAGEEEAEPPPAPPDREVVDRSAEAQRFLADRLAHRPPPRQVALPAGFRIRRVTEAGLAVPIPPHWQALSGFDARHPGVLRTLGRLNPELGLAVAALAQADSPLKLVAFAPDFHRGFVTTASVLQLPVVPGARYPAWSAKALAAARGLESRRGPVTSRRVQLPYGEALRIVYLRRDQGTVAMTVQYVLVRGSTSTLLTLTTLPGLGERYVPAFESLAQALQSA